MTRLDGSRIAVLVRRMVLEGVYQAAGEVFRLDVGDVGLGPFLGEEG